MGYADALGVACAMMAGSARGPCRGSLGWGRYRVQPPP